MTRFRLFSCLLILVGLLGTACCSPCYLFHLSEGQARILMGMKPVEKYLQNSDVSPEVVRKIRMIQDAKAFGQDVLGLTSAKSYTHFYEVKNPPLGYNLIASPPLDLQAHRWCFPIAGCVPYKGFFKKKRVVRAGRKMRDKGFDVYIRPFSAYSTLGWFRDPIFSTWLKASDTTIVDTVLHEMVHATVYVKDQSAFNESLAVFIGGQGAQAFFTEDRHEDSAFFEKWDEARAGFQTFREVMGGLAEDLKALYASELADAEKLERKDMLFSEARQKLQDALPATLKKRYASVFRAQWNNAFLIAHLTYHRDVSMWEDVLERFHGDLPAMVAWTRNLRGRKDPTACVKAWLESGELPARN